MTPFSAYTPPSPPPSPSVRLENDDFIVTTSRDGNTNACYLDGQCVRANYGDDQNCTIQAKRDLTLDVTSFNVEGSNYQEGCSDLYGNDCLCDYMCGGLTFVSLYPLLYPCPPRPTVPS